MTIDFIYAFLLWCTVINYGLLLVWFAFFTLAHGWIYRFHGRWFRVPVEQFDAIHYMSMAVFKLGIILFNLTPLVSLYVAA